MKFGKLAGLVGLIVVLLLLWSLRQVLLLLFAAVVFATVLNRMVQLLRKLHIPRQLAVPLVLLAVTASAVLAF